MQSFSLNGIDIEKSAVNSAMENENIIIVSLNNGIEIRIPKSVTPMTARDFTVEEIEDIPVRRNFIEVVPGTKYSYEDVVGINKTDRANIKILTTDGKISPVNLNDNEISILEKKMCGDPNEIYVTHDYSTFIVLRNGIEYRYGFGSIRNYKYHEMSFNNGFAYAFFNYGNEKHIMKQYIGKIIETKNWIEVINKIINMK